MVPEPRTDGSPSFPSDIPSPPSHTRVYQKERGDGRMEKRVVWLHVQPAGAAHHHGPPLAQHLQGGGELLRLQALPQRLPPRGGVVLTLDRGIQQQTEAAMDQVEKGAAVVMAVDTGEIMAMVSRPAYDLTRIADFLQDPDSPFFDRALAARWSTTSVASPATALRLASTKYRA